MYNLTKQLVVIHTLALNNPSISMEITCKIFDLNDNRKKK